MRIFTALILLMLAASADAASRRFYVTTPGQIATGGGAYVPYAVGFDGGNDAMTNVVAATGVADGYEFTYSVWIYPSNTASDQYLVAFAAVTSQRHYIQRLADGRLRAFGASSGGTTKTDTYTVNPVAQDAWSYVLIAISRTQPLTNIYINGTLTAVTNAVWTGNDGTPTDFNASNPRFGVGAYVNQANKYNGALCEPWWDDSIVDDPTKFRDAGTGKPKSLGSDGSAVGVTPVFYFRGQGNAFGTNYGSGGSDFTVVGSLTDVTPP